MIYSLDLDITPNGVPQIVKLSQYDKTMPTLAIKLYNGSQVFTIPTGCTAYIEGTKADKTGFQYPCTVSGGVINATITEQMTAFAGRVPCEIVLRKSGERKGSANFFLDIEPSALSDDTVISDSDLPIIQQMPEYAQSCADDAELAHKWATFGSDSETPSATNNAKYWAEQAEAVTGVGDLMTTRSKLGAKNLLPYPYEAPTHEMAGIMWTVNVDGSITASGTATGRSYFAINTGKGILQLSFPKGSYIVSLEGIPARVFGRMGWYNSSNTYIESAIQNINVANTSRPLNVNDTQATYHSEFIIEIPATSAGTTFNFTVYPMIRLATDHDSTYQPYAMTNKELTEDMQAIECDKTTAGTYTLQCVVDSSGNKTYSWV